MARQHDRVARHVPHRTPREQQVGQLVERGSPPGHHVELVRGDGARVGGLHQQATVDAPQVELRRAARRRGVPHLEQRERGPPRQHPQGLVRVGGRHDRLVGADGELLRRGCVHDAVDRQHRAEGRHRVALQGVSVCVEQGVRRRKAHRVELLGDAAAGCAEVGHRPPRRVEVEQVVVGRVRPLDLARLRQRARPPGRLPVQGGLLLRVGAVPQVACLAQHDGQVVRELQPADVVEIRGHVGVVGGDRREGACRQPHAGLRGDQSVPLHLLDEHRVLRRMAGDRDRGVVPRRRGQQGHACHVDHRERFVDGHHPAADMWLERGHADHHQVHQPDAPDAQELQLIGRVAPREDAREHLGMEGGRLAGDGGVVSGDHGQGIGGHPVTRQPVAGARGRKELDPERPEPLHELYEAVLVRVRDREQGTQRRGPPSVSSIKGRSGRVGPGPRYRAEYTRRPDRGRTLCYPPGRDRTMASCAPARRGERVRGPHVPGHLLSHRGGRAHPAPRHDRPVQRPDPEAPPPPTVGRDVGVDPVDRGHRVWPGAHRGRSSTSGS